MPDTEVADGFSQNKIVSAYLTPQCLAEMTPLQEAFLYGEKRGDSRGWEGNRWSAQIALNITR